MRAAALVVLFAACLAVQACGEDGTGSAPRVSAVATTTQLGDFAREVAGDRAAVKQMLTPNADPHDYEPRPSDVRALEDADVILKSGGELDEWLSEVIESSGGDGSAVDVSRAVRLTGDDPHWWQDPRNAEAAVKAIRDALAEADPGGRGTYRANATAYLARLRALDAGVARCIGKLPRRARKLVTTHDALGYYADRYGLEVIGAVIPSLSSQAQPSSKDVGDLVDLIRREDVKAIFPESSIDSKLERAISRESGATVGGELWADTLGPQGSSGETYIDSVEANTRAIADGLSGGAVRCF